MLVQVKPLRICRVVVEKKTTGAGESDRQDKGWERNDRVDRVSHLPHPK